MSNSRPVPSPVQVPIFYRVACVSLPEPEPLPDLLREDPRPALLHGGPLSGGHEDLDGRDCHGGGGIHAVHELSARFWSRMFRQGFSVDPPRFLLLLLFSSPPRTQRLVSHPSFFIFLNCTLRFLRCRCFHLYVFYVILLGLKKGALGGHTHLYINQTYTCQRLQKSLSILPNGDLVVTVS